MSEYTPPIAEMGRAYAELLVERRGGDEAEYLAEFDRALAAHDAQVRADERERIAEAIEAARPEYERSPWRMGMDEAARIARTEPTDSEES